MTEPNRPSASADQPMGPTSSWSLKSVHLPGVAERIEIDPERGLTVGRSPSNDIVLAGDEFLRVSAHHARIKWVDGAFVLEDLASTNGTFLNGTRITERVRLGDGDRVCFGSLEIKFVVERAGDLSQTTFFDAVEAPPDERPSQVLRRTTLIRLRKAIGLEPGTNVKQMVQRTARRSRRNLIVTAVCMLVVGAGVAWWLTDRGRRDREEALEEIELLREQNRQLVDQLEATNTLFDRQQTAWEAERSSLERERGRLETRLVQLQAEGQASASELLSLRQRLDETTRNLARFDPVSLEQSKLEGVRRVRSAVVFIETRLVLRDPDSGDYLRVVVDEDGDRVPRIGSDGELLSRENTGSGFVVSKDGHIITNAHVVVPDGHDQSVPFGDGIELEPEVLVDVVFSGKSERRRAAVLKFVYEDDEDLALLKIDPFDAMQFLGDFRTDAAPPVEGSEVFLFGFPLGRAAVHDGDTVVGSTFKGILSRSVSRFLQVDAAVHPGNSGGPLTDALGRVIGVVTAVQRTPSGQLAPEIGYVIPIEAAAKIWPPAPPKTPR